MDLSSEIILLDHDLKVLNKFVQHICKNKDSIKIKQSKLSSI